MTTAPYCAACLVLVPDITVNHHVCVDDGKGGFTATTRDDAAKARERSVKDGVSVHEAFVRNAADAAKRPPF